MLGEGGMLGLGEADHIPRRSVGSSWKDLLPEKRWGCMPLCGQTLRRHLFTLFGTGGLENLGGPRSSLSFPCILFLALLCVSMWAVSHHLCHHLLILFSPFRHQKLGAKTRWMSRSMRSTPKWMP